MYGHAVVDGLAEGSHSHSAPMVYERHALLSERGETRNFLRALRRTLRDYPRVKKFRNSAALCNLVPLGPERSISSGDVPLVLPVRNELLRLPPFLRHYRNAGVTRFLIVDDGSTDGTREYLAKQPDVDLFESDVRFDDAHHGTKWLYRLVERYGFGRWYVVVDADEYLVYPGMDEHPLPDLLAWLSRKGRSRLLAPMIDFFPVGRLNEAHFDPHRWPWQVANYFDLEGYRMRRKSIGPMISGGAAERIFGTPHLLQKYPLIFWDRSTIHFPDIHNPYPYYRSDTQILGALLHFKIFSDLPLRSHAAVADNQHSEGARKYKEYYDKACNGLNILPRPTISAKYNSPRQLVDLGFMERIEWT